MTSWIRALGAALLTACALAPVTHANVLIGGTRVVLPAKDGEVTVRLTNDNQRPALVQAWIDRGDAHSSPDQVDTPFLVTPPLFRMEPQRDQSLRILYTREPLPGDRESVFWLNVLEVPPKPTDLDAASKNYLQLALRSRLKLFFRPEGLAGDPLKAPEQLTFKAVAADGGCVLIVRNPTPYHVTINELALQLGAKSHTAQTGMVPPLAELRLPVQGLDAPPPSGTPVRLSIINDYGASVPLTGALTP